MISRRKWWKIGNPGIMVRRNRKKINENPWRDVKIQKGTKKGGQNRSDSMDG